MGKDSGIQWTDNTFNPWWGCVRVSPGCANCYAEAFDKRVGRADWGALAPRRLFGETHWHEPKRWNLAAERSGVRARVFCASMADVFEDFDPRHLQRRELEEARSRLFALIEATPWLDWLLLSKRPENMTRLAPATWSARWPANVWPMTTCEDQKRADERIPHLLRVPAAVRGLSVEPQIEEIDLAGWFGDQAFYSGDALSGFIDYRPGVSWVICGGESGPKARPFDLAWMRSLRDQCKAADVAFFAKQFGSRAVQGIFDDGERHLAPLRLADAHGGDPAEWPADLQNCRAFPASAGAL